MAKYMANKDANVSIDMAAVFIVGDGWPIVGIIWLIKAEIKMADEMGTTKTDTRHGNSNAML
jgi:hypothetical protein